MYRNEWDAAVARATALEHQLKQAQASQSVDAATIATLTQQLATANAELARLRGGVFPGGGYPPPGYPPPGYPPPGYPPYAPAGVFLQPARGSTILVLGILSLVVCSVLGPIAWSMGNEELRRIDRGEVDPTTRSSVNAGRVCGMISSILMIVSVVFLLGFFVLAVGASR